MAPYPLVPFFNLLAGALTALLLPWRLHSWNVGICSSIIWISVLCICTGINTVVWRDNVEDVAPAWCEIVTRILIDGSVAIPACSMATIRRLYLTACSRSLASTRPNYNRSRAIFIDLTICFGFPLFIITPLCYVIQGHRYNIVEGSGCRIAIVNTYLAFVLLFMWPVLLGSISLIYSALIIRTVLIRRRELNEYLTSAKTAVDYNLFYRVIALTAADAAFTIPLGVLIIYINATHLYVTPHFDWADVHFDFGRIEKFTTAQMAAANDPWLGFVQIWTEWIYVVCAAVLFVVYGTSMDLVRFYCNGFWSCVGRLGYQRREKKKPMQTTIQFASVVEAGGHDWDERTERDTIESTKTFEALTHSKNSLELEDRTRTV